MMVHSNLYSEDKLYDTTKDTEAIKGIIYKVIAKDSGTIASTGTLVRLRNVVKFKDGSWCKKGSLFTMSEQRSHIIDRVEELGITKSVSGVVLIKNMIGVEKKYLVSDTKEFEELMIILDFMGELKLCSAYEVKGVSTDKNISPKQRRLEDKYFFMGEEVELIKWAVENKIWKWLRRVEV